MKRAFQDVLDSLKSLRDGVLPSTQAFPPLDVDQISRDLDLEHLARERPITPADGAAESAELRISQEVQNRARKAAEEYRTRLALYESRIREATASSELRIEIEAAGRAALSDFDMLGTNDRNHLFTRRLEVRDREAEYDRFRSAHGLTRLARTPSTTERIVIRLVLAIAFCGESIINGMFFAQGSEGGLIGGVLQAAVLAILNVVAAIAFAVYGRPALVHRSLILKVFGTAAFLCYIGWALFINLVIAHFRELFIPNTGQVDMNILWGRVLTDPWTLQDPQSWLLGCLGLIISLIAAISASRLDDPYWGYGEVARAREHAIAQFAAEKELCLFRLQNRRDEAVDDMKEVMHELRRYEYERRLAVTGRERLHQDFMLYLDHLAGVYGHLVGNYRTLVAKELEEQQLPAPSFSSQVGSIELPRPALESIPKMDDDIRDEAVRKLEHYIKAINDEFAKRVREYATHADIEPAVVQVEHAAA